MRPATYTARLKVTSSAGRTKRDTSVVHVITAARKRGSPATGRWDSTRSAATFDASASSSGNWTISFGDGTPDVTGTGVPPVATPHHFDHTGIFTTTLTVADPDTGLTGVARAISTVPEPRCRAR